MYTDRINATKVRPTSALERALHAREQEKEMALLMGMYKSQTHVREKAKRNIFTVLLTGLFNGM